MVFPTRETLIAAGEALTGYTFNNAELLWEAEQASGSNAAYLYPEGNKRLALIGDAVLRLVVLDDLRPQNMTRESMHSLTKNIIENTNLERVGRRIHLEDIVNKNPAQLGLVSKNTLTATVEAILAAVYLDSGKNIEPVQLVMARLGLWPEESEQLASL